MESILPVWRDILQHTYSEYTYPDRNEFIFHSVSLESYSILSLRMILSVLLLCHRFSEVWLVVFSCLDLPGFDQAVLSICPVTIYISGSTLSR